MKWLIKSMVNNQQTDNLDVPYRKRPWQVIIICALTGIVILLVSESYLCDSWKSLANVFGQALLVGALVSFLIDLPSTFSYFQKVFLHTLTSDDYLSRLSTDDLTTLRKICTKHLNIKHVRLLEPGLIELDEKILSQITEPYYERYRHTVSAEEKVCNGKKFIEKTVNIEKTLVNPLADQKVHPDIGLCISLLKGENEKIDDYFELSKFTVKIDSGPAIDYKENIKIAEKKRVSDNVDSIYNTDIHLQANNSISKDGIEFEFDKIIEVSYKYKILVPCEDKIFTKRVELPTKSFFIDYNMEGQNIVLCGDLYGTMQYRDKKKYKVTQKKNGITIESYEWILPGDGVYVVELKKDNDC